ncbi:MAG: hypothetical protein NPINA01_00240 [Nitrospinaceae bacterium]|nr:MAG: hypothetical protein NPINA01_00240 [Nitrospinaceae bacterium]
MITTEQIMNAKILVVDDEPANIMVLEETLKQKGHTSIQTVSDPRNALEYYQSFQPDLVLLDLNMPHFNGFQVMDQIQKANSKGNVPIMILTAQVDQGTRLRALDAGARDFLTKPFDILEVSLRIQNMLEISLLQSQSQNSNSSLHDKYEKTILELAATKLKLQKEINRREELEEQLRNSAIEHEKS